MSPLQDITLYYDGTIIPGVKEDWDFRNKANYVCDFYHKMLDGYKPPKTGRICISIDSIKKWDDSWYFGSICHISNIIDETKYLLLSKLEKYRYLLDIVHESCSTLANFYKWDIDKFENAYNKIIEMNFQFSIIYPAKLSRDKKKSAKIILNKTETITTVNLCIVSEGKNTIVILFEKKNWWNFDSVYKMVRGCKWIDNERFGMIYKPHNWSVSYSIATKKIVFEKDGIESNKSNIEKVFNF